MSLADLLPSVQSLPRADKFRLVQHLVADLAREEGVASPEPGVTYPVWSPYDSYEAATVLQRLLEQEKATS
jgi:hypothetical protein